MLIGVIADDFTGASDIANTLAKGVAPEGGLATAQFSGVPKDPASGEVEAGVIALKSRSAPVAEAVAESLAALDWLLAQGCRQIVFKYCSTFDSTPQGNIGPVAEALADALGAASVVVCPAFPAAGRTIYQGHLFVFDRLLSESGMQSHPLTPMTDPDLRRWLGLQTKGAVGHVPIDQVRGGPAAIAAALDAQAAAGRRLCVVDALTEADLVEIGAAVAEARLVTGGSGIALGLPRNFIRNARSACNPAAPRPVAGPEAILVGSCSGATRGQIEVHRRAHPVLEIDVPGVMEGRVTPADLVAFMAGNVGRAPLAFSSGTPEEVRALQERFGREAVSGKLDALFAEAARELLRRGWRRIVVGGGETSGAVASAVADQLGREAMQIGPEIDPGVPILLLGEEAPVSLALKSGNFGAADFFAKALARMETGR
jgi:uncharacterized protein YgbK (DUF1537 family)